MDLTFDTLYLGKCHKWFSTLPSTNDYIKEQLQQGEKIPNGFMVGTDFQSLGRGQRNSAWISDPGSNLCFSIFIQPKFVSVENNFLVSQTIAAGIYDWLAQHSDGFTIKWPNDLLYNQFKVGGILIENQIQSNQLQSSIVGIGLNLGQKKFPLFQRPATSLKNITGKGMPLKNALQSLLPFLERRLVSLRNGKVQEIRDDYHNVLYGRGRALEFQDGLGKFDGTILGVEENGLLKLDRGGKIHLYDFKSITYLE